MTTISNPYDTLYTKLKDRLTVVHDNCEYTVGEYMLAKSGKKSADKNLPIVSSASEPRAVSSIFNYVNDKLTVKTPAKKEKTIRRFPLRTSASALLSAVAACALVVSCGVYSLIGASDSIPYTAEAEESVEIEAFEAETEIPEADFGAYAN